MEQFIPLALLLGVMYFLLIRPQKQRVKAQRTLLTSLHVGDEIVTIAGILGHIVALRDEEVSVETTPGTVLRLRRGAIASRVEKSAVATDTAPGDDA
jgi:preprotein translocase subunit YajC